MAVDFKKVAKEKKQEAQSLMTDEQMKKCNLIIHTASVTSISGAITPLSDVDAIPISAAQVAMVLSLGKVFDREISENVAKGVVSAVTSSFVGKNLVKLIPAAGIGFAAVVAGGVTEAIGWIAAVDMVKNERIEIESYKGDEESIDHSATGKECSSSVGDYYDSNAFPNLYNKSAPSKSTDEEQPMKNRYVRKDVDDESAWHEFANVFEEDEE